MKAIILAAGRGERLGDITKETPKPMILFKEKPVLQYNIELCQKYGVTDLYINLYHLGNRIRDYFEDGKRFGVRITYSVENELMGTAGAVKRIAKNFWSLSHNHQFNNLSTLNLSCEEPFFVLYGDNFSNYNLQALLDLYEKRKPIGIIGFHYREDVSTSGVAEFDKEGRIIRFIEKPKDGETDSHWVNAGIYLFNSDILYYIPDSFSDFGKDIFPSMLKKRVNVFGIKADTEVLAFDTPSMLNQNIQ